VCAQVISAALLELPSKHLLSNLGLETNNPQTIKQVRYHKACLARAHQPWIKAPARPTFWQEQHEPGLLDRDQAQHAMAKGP
jgi:hypothetical protein